MNKEVIKNILKPNIENENITTITIMGTKGSGKTYGTAILSNNIEVKKVLFDITGTWTRDKLLKNATYVNCNFDKNLNDKKLKDLSIKVLSDFGKSNKKNLVLNTINLNSENLTRFFEIINVLCKDAKGQISIIVDEAGEVFPQDTRRFYADESQKIVRLGRNWGISPYIIITQRPQKVDKNVLANSDLFIFFKTIYPLEQEIIKNIIGMDTETFNLFKPKISSLQKGECFIFSPAINLFSKCKFDLETQEIREINEERRNRIKEILQEQEEV